MACSTPPPTAAEQINSLVHRDTLRVSPHTVRISLDCYSTRFRHDTLHQVVDRLDYQNSFYDECGRRGYRYFKYMVVERSDSSADDSIFYKFPDGSRYYYRPAINGRPGFERFTPVVGMELVNALGGDEAVWAGVCKPFEVVPLSRRRARRYHPYQFAYGQFGDDSPYGTWNPYPTPQTQSGMVDACTQTDPVTVLPAGEADETELDVKAEPAEATQ